MCQDSEEIINGGVGMGKDYDLVKQVEKEMLEKYGGLHAGVGISPLATIRNLYGEGMYQHGRDSLPAQEDGLCVTVNLLDLPAEDFEYITEQNGVHIFYRVTGEAVPYK